MEGYSVKLSERQQKAVASLRRALKRCEDEEVYLWDDYGVIGAANGSFVRTIAPDSGLDTPLNPDDTEILIYDGWYGATPDDPLYVGWK